MDNAAFHRSKEITGTILDHGFFYLFLPPYSPDLNPIEHYWYEIKSRVRKKTCNTFDMKKTIESCFYC